MTNSIEKIDTALQACSAIVDDEKTLDEERLTALFDAIADLLANRSEESNSDEAVSRTLASIRSFYLSERYEDESPAAAFGMGSMWGAVKVYDSYLRQLKSKHDDIARRLNLEVYENILVEVMRSPGITHAELAQKCSKSVSRLTQIVSSIDEYDLLVSLRMGREKHYYLSEYAASLLSPFEETSNTKLLSNSVRADGDGECIYARAWVYDYKHPGSNDKNVVLYRGQTPVERMRKPALNVISNNANVTV